MPALEDVLLWFVLSIQCLYDGNSKVRGHHLQAVMAAVRFVCLHTQPERSWLCVGVAWWAPRWQSVGRIIEGWHSLAHVLHGAREQENLQVSDFFAWPQFNYCSSIIGCVMNATRLIQGVCCTTESFTSMLAAKVGAGNEKVRKQHKGVMSTLLLSYCNSEKGPFIPNIGTTISVEAVFGQWDRRVQYPGPRGTMMDFAFSTSILT